MRQVFNKALIKLTNLINSSSFEIREDEHGIGKVLILKTQWSDRIYNYMKKNEILALRLPQSMDFKSENLSFLTELTFLKSLELYDWDAKDITKIETLSQLEVFGAQFTSNKKINFTNFKKLRVAKFTWRKGLTSILELDNLEELNIENYGEINLESISHMKKLKKLYITSRKLETLKGIEKLDSLELLDLYNCQKLFNTSGIELCKKLKTIEIEACNKL